MSLLTSLFPHRRVPRYVSLGPFAALAFCAGSPLYSGDAPPFGAGSLAAATFSSEPLVDFSHAIYSPDGQPLPGDLGFYYRDWTARFGGTFAENWLTNAASGTEGGLQITGAGDPVLVGSFGTSNAEWIAPGSGAACFSSGNVYFLRATASFNGVKSVDDTLRLLIQENSRSSNNQSFNINAPDSVDLGGGSIDHPLIPPLNTPRQYLSAYDPFDNEIAGFNDGGPGGELPFLVGFDTMDILGNGPMTVTVSEFQIGSIPTGEYFANVAPNPGGGFFGGIGGAAFDGSDADFYDGWSRISDEFVPITLVGGEELLGNPASSRVSASSIEVDMRCVDAEANPNDIQFVEFSNFGGDVVGPTLDLDVVEFLADAAYCVEYGVQANGGAMNPAIPEFRLRVATPIPTFSIEYLVTTSRGAAFPADDTTNHSPVYFTGPPQVDSAAPGAIGQENDLQLIFGPLGYLLYTDGTLRLMDSYVHLLGANDPNIDY